MLIIPELVYVKSSVKTKERILIIIADVSETVYLQKNGIFFFTSTLELLSGETFYKGTVPSRANFGVSLQEDGRRIGGLWTGIRDQWSPTQNIPMGTSVVRYANTKGPKLTFSRDS